MTKILITLFLLLADYLLLVLAAAFTLAAGETLYEKYKRYKALKFTVDPSRLAAGETTD